MRVTRRRLAVFRDKYLPRSLPARAVSCRVPADSVHGQRVVAGPFGG